MRPKVKENLLLIFIGAHLLGAVLFSFSLFAPALNAQPLRPYFEWVGLWQAWNMFSPHPPTSNEGLRAEIRYLDGTQEIWNFPRLAEVPVLLKARRERWRKWSVDSLIRKNHPLLWVDAARWIAWTHRAKSPTRVVILAYWQKIELNGFPGASGQALKMDYQVRPEDTR